MITLINNVNNATMKDGYERMESLKRFLQCRGVTCHAIWAFVFVTDTTNNVSNQESNGKYFSQKAPKLRSISHAHAYVLSNLIHTRNVAKL